MAGDWCWLLSVIFSGSTPCVHVSSSDITDRRSGDITERKAHDNLYQEDFEDSSGLKILLGLASATELLWNGLPRQFQPND